MANSNVAAQAAKVSAQVVVRDKHGNVKYQGPLEMNVVSGSPEDIKEEDHGGNAPHGS